MTPASLFFSGLILGLWAGSLAIAWCANRAYSDLEDVLGRAEDRADYYRSKANAYHKQILASVEAPEPAPQISAPNVIRHDFLRTGEEEIP